MMKLHNLNFDKNVRQIHTVPKGVKMEDKVDILLATYNTKIEFLKMQLDSILNQTYSNFNLIISDDCSPNEEVREILKEYEKKDNRIQLYFQKKNLGYTNVMWSLAYDDWDENKQGRQEYGKKKVLDNIHPGAVILLHATSKDNSEILGEVIKEVRNMGYEFKKLDEFEK